MAYIRAEAPELTLDPTTRTLCGGPSTALEQALWQTWAIRMLGPIEAEEFEVAP